MSENQDVRWKQRFSNYQKALSQLGEFLTQQNLNRLEEQGLIHAFEYTYELAWNTLKDFLEYQGVAELVGSRDTFRKAVAKKLVREGRVWMRMIECKNKTTHTYNESTAREIVNFVRSEFYAAFCELNDVLSRRVAE